MKKWKCVLALPGDALYLREQAAAAKAAADRLGVELQVVSAGMDPVTQSQQLLGFVQSPAASRPDAIIIEPVTAAGLPRVAEAAAAAGIAWVVNNAEVEYLAALRRSAKAPVFLTSVHHVEVGRLQGRQLAALLPEGGAVLYLRGPAMSSVACLRFEGLESAKPQNVEVKSLKVQGSTADNACAAVSSWLNLSTVRPEGLQLIVAQNADFILGARKAFETKTAGPDRGKWLALRCAGVGIAKQMKPLVDQGVMRAAAVTSVTTDKTLEILVRALKDGSQPPERSYVEAYSYPSLEDLARKPLSSHRGSLATA